MGDRANVYISNDETHGVYLYTHWAGSELPETVRKALIRGRERWEDDQYLARIVFAEMIHGDTGSLTGYGIAAFCGDGDSRVILVDVDKKTVAYAKGECGKYERPSVSGLAVSFEEYVKQERTWPR